MRRILISRPAEERTHALLDRLNEMGWRPIHLPLLECSERRERIPAPARYDLLICASLRAARIFLRLTRARELPRCIGPGRRTADFLRERGVTVVHPERAVGSEAMLALPELQHPKGRRVLLLCGTSGRGLLETELRRRGAQVDKLMLYDCRPCHYAAADWRQAAPLDAVWITSGELLTALNENIRKNKLAWLHRSALILAGDRLVKLAEKLPFRQCIGLRDADNETLLEYISTVDGHIWQNEKRHGLP